MRRLGRVYPSIMDPAYHGHSAVAYFMVVSRVFGLVTIRCKQKSRSLSHFVQRAALFRATYIQGRA